MHFESHVMDKPEILQSCLPELQKVYVALEEPDYVAGLAAIRRKEASLEEMIHQHTAMGNFQVIRSIFNYIQNKSFIDPNCTNIFSNIHITAFLGYHKDKIRYKIALLITYMSKKY